MYSARIISAASALGLLLTVMRVSAVPDDAAVSFEKQIQPILEQRCFECHSHQSGKAKGGLVLDSKAGWETGGDSGPAIVSGDVTHSRLLRAVRREQEDLQMPPKKKLSAQEVQLLVRWVQQGAPDPRAPVAAATKKHSINYDEARHQWPFAPLTHAAVPPIRNPQSAIRNPIDLFIQEKLAAAHLPSSPRASARTLIRRAYFDLIGLPPTYEEVEAFANDASPDAFPRLVDRLLDRPEYGQRWGRHWLDVARYADTTEQSVDGERRIPFAHTYRDYVIESLNADKPFDRFVLEQIAADRLPDAKPEDLRALGFLTVGRRFASNIEAANLVIDDRIDVIGRGFLGLTLACARCHDHKFDPIPTADYYSLFGILGSVQDWRETPELGHSSRTPAVEKYETDRAKLLRDWDEHVDHCLVRANEHFRKMATEYLRYLVRSSPNHRTTEGSIPFDTPSGLLYYQAPGRWQALLDQSHVSGEPFFMLWHSLMALKKENFSTDAKPILAALAENPAGCHPWVVQAFAGKNPATMLEVADLYGALIQRALKEDSMEAHAIVDLIYGPHSPLPPSGREDVAEDMPRFITEHSFLHRSDGEAGMKILTSLSILDATAPVERPPAVKVSAKPLDPHILVRGEMKHAGAAVPRKFLTVLSGVDARSYEDDGRLQLAKAIVNPKNPLTARVIVNRVWQQHFGTGLVSTSDNFGVMGDKPSHPELLDYLAQWFMDHRWSLKALHRFMMSSAIWQQESGRGQEPTVNGQQVVATDGDGAQGSSPLTRDPLTVDPSNRLLWRMSPRRLEFEPLRDSLLYVSASLDEKFGGRSKNLGDDNHRRAVYLYTDRFRIPALLRNFDVANPDTSISKRSESVVPLQALFLFNSQFVHQRAEALLRRPEIASASTAAARIRAAFRTVLSRDPGPEEIQISQDYLKDAPLNNAGAAQWTSFLQGLLLSDEFVFVD